jgi:hypothetical protein
MKPYRLWTIIGGLLITCASLAAFRPATPAPAASSYGHMAINCEYSSLCTEVADSSQVFGSQ